ncbi:uncharacterized protein LOC105182724 [Harpegnathos saltator]|uniref:uncharacterized protein LOC105182724 n=1 Tax=Harpegnathos saltator TaxID=610380 RepID=UPI0005911FBE|nr:uncharacterized protein LOC105182724 [Harpegnathos saltator]
MTERVNAIGTSLRLLALVWLSCATRYKFSAVAQPLPLAPDFTYGDLVAGDPESLMLLNRLKQVTEQKHRVVEQEHEITDEQINIEAMLQAKAMEQQRGQTDYPVEEAEPEPEPEPEALPVPAAMVHRGQQQPTSGKRKPNSGVTYMSLCHFKICNMGRKRQSH